jgi:hypothetical protein
MDEVTQQNSALVEENAATAETLEGRAGAMDNCVAFFKLNDAARSNSGAPQSRQGQDGIVAMRRSA